MRKYIVKQKAISALITEADTHSNPVKKAYTRAAAIIEQIAAEDVQPVDRWISVEERLPDKFDYVLCYCKTTTGEGNEFMFGAYHNGTWWLKTCRTYATLEQPQMRVMYWMPLPKIVSGMKSADVQPVKHGTWRKDEQGYDVYVECSECGLNLNTSDYIENEWREILKYCPNCGARMDGGADNENSN